jgi:SAM-dependent methyltransferase
MKEGKYPDDVWDIPIVRGKEAIGYPTQKPLALMERIIKATSNENDVVLDAFCGGGTTLVAAAKLNRRFIGIDQSVQAIKVSQARLENTLPGADIIENTRRTEQGLLFRPTFAVIMHKYNYDNIRNSPPFEFERFIVEQYGGESHAKQRGDLGIDGELRDGKAVFPIQVKRSDNIGRNVIDNFRAAIARFDKLCKRGYIIAFSFGRGAIEEVARLKREEGIEIGLVRVDSIIPIAQKPHISLSFDWREDGNKKEVSFTAAGEGVELWQWDWDYDEVKGFAAEVMRDTGGRQILTLAVGTYNIAVRGVDADGIDAIETIRLVVNGGVCKE